MADNNQDYDKTQELRAQQKPAPTAEECRERILSNEYADFIYNTDVNYQDVQELYRDYCVQIMNRQFVGLYSKRTNMLPLTIGNYTYEAFPNCYALMDTTALDISGITTLQNQPALRLTGRDVLVGVIDTGIDYQNDVFRRSDGSSRIVSIWDQTDQSGVPPEDLLYGSVYSQEQINQALQSENPYDIVPSGDETGHGTMLAALAAGSANKEQEFIGAAPDADLVIVKLKEAKAYLKEFYYINPEAHAYQENDIMYGIHFIGQIAVQENKPLVILIGLGTNQGDHAGGSPLCQYISNVLDGRGRAIVLANGNEANQAHHYRGRLNRGMEYEDVEIRVGEGEIGFTMELWGQLPNVFSVSVISPTGEVIPKIANRIGYSDVFNLILSGTTIHLDYRSSAGAQGAQVIILKFEKPLQGIWTIRVYGNNIQNGIYDMWLPVQGFTVTDVVFLRPDPDITLTDPASTQAAISVGAYNDRNNSIYLDSGRGFNRVDQVKPEITAPGVEVFTGLTGNRFGRRTGTSVAAALTAGAAAQILQWAVTDGNMPLISPGLIKYYLISGARTNPSIEYPNPAWGYGELDLYAFFQGLGFI